MIILALFHSGRFTFVHFALSTMARSELAVLLAFLFSFTLVYAWSLCMACGWIYRRMRRRGEPTRPRWRRIVRRTVLTLAAVGLLCMLYAWQVEPYWPQVSTWRAPTAKLPKDAKPIRIVHLSDTHCEGKIRLEDRLPGMIAELKPDLIVFTGDAINSGAGLPVFQELMNRLCDIAPVYAVRGNWDYDNFGESDFCAGTRAKDISGKVAKLDIRGTPLYLVGVGWPGWGDGIALQQRVPKGAMSVLLYHTPDIVCQETITSDLVLCGHTHGGQIALPFYGGMITLAREGKKYERDLHDLPSGGKIHTSRGIGMEGGNAPRMRFFSRPDVSVIEIAPE